MAGCGGANLGRATDLTLTRLEHAAATLAGNTPSSLTAPPLLLATKLTPPRRQAMIRRESLNRRLCDALTTPVTLISAPAGWGKTTLLAQALEPIPQTAWLTLDAGDNDPVRFWSYLLGALQRHAPAVAALAAALRAPAQPSITLLLTSLINLLATPTDTRHPPIILALDDYHVIESQAIHHDLSFLIEQIPERLRLVITSRGIPALPLARWRAGGLLSEITARDLRFDTSAAATLVGHVSGHLLSAEQIATLAQRTEGWPAGLQLAGLALRDTTAPGELLERISGSHPLFFDYLIGEIVERQPPPITDLLLHTCILDRLCADLCDALFDTLPPPGTTHATLAAIERAGLFLTPLDAEGRWYRYHTLFADALRSHLAATNAERLRELHRRAMQWHATRYAAGDTELATAAIEHALAAGEAQQAANLVCSMIRTTMWIRGEMHTLQRWIAALPAELVQQIPELLLAQCWSLMATIQLDRAGALISRLEQQPAAHDAPVAGEIAALRSYIARIHGDLAGGRAYAMQALELLTPHQDIARLLTILNYGTIALTEGDLHRAGQIAAEMAIAVAAHDDLPPLLTLSAVQLAQADLSFCQARLHEAEAFMLGSLQVAARLPPDSLQPTAPIYASLCNLYYEWNDLELAEWYGRQSLALGRNWYNYDVLCAASSVLGRVRRARGDQQEAAELFDQARTLALEYNVPQITREQQLGRAWQSLWEGDLSAAAAQVVARGLQLSDIPDPARFEEYELLVRVAISDGRAAPALALIRRMQQQAASGGFTIREIRVRLLETLAYHTAGEPRAAIDSLASALALAEPGGMIRIFLDEGHVLQELLAALLREPRHHAYHAYVRRILQRSTPTGSRTMLSKREHAILRLVAAGASNQAIADQLVISIHTVKKHLSNILGKLATTSRTEAAARARELGLLDTSG
ncbi:MAG TPA: LuxR C-terminal-related transcriptional regulator [Roseiflexaceae bacterium]|nr:LuxR C-terminal-related transcriptional regulator [Roseiflexaceae bacterium]